MLHDNGRRELDAAIDQLKRTRSFRSAEKDLDYRAVALVGFTEPCPGPLGSNQVRYPVRVAMGKSPEDAAETDDRGNPIFEPVVLAYVWTRSDRHARRLKEALDRRLLGADPTMTRLRGYWRDLPEWEVAWPILLGDAIKDLQDAGEAIEYFSEEIRIQRTRRHAHGKATGSA